MNLKKDLNNNGNDFIDKSKKFIYNVAANICKKVCIGKMMMNLV